MTIENGVWVSAYAEPDSVAMCLPVPGKLRICGQVIGCKPLPNLKPGNVPTCSITIRGRLGKTMTLDFTAHHTTIHPSQEAAIAACKQKPQVDMDGAKYICTVCDGGTLWRLKDGSSFVSNTLRPPDDIIQATEARSRAPAHRIPSTPRGGPYHRGRGRTGGPD